MKTATKKRTRLAESQTSTTAATAPPAGLNTTQEKIIDAVSEMLAHGGHPDNIEQLLRASLGHRFRRELEDSFKDLPEDRERVITRWLAEGLGEWKTDLAIAWRANQRADRPEIEPKTFSERIRAQSRDVLIEHSEEFLRSAEPEEIQVLVEILDFRNGGIIDRIKGVNEIPLGEAFGCTLDRNETYIRIPKGLRGKVQKYIDALITLESEAA